MSKSRIKAQVELVEPEQEIDIAKLDDGQQFELVAVSIEAVCASLEARGVDAEIVSTVLLEAFCYRMAEVNDRSAYEELLEDALATEWEDVTVH